MQCYCRDEFSDGVVSMLPVVGMDARRALVSKGGVALKVSLFERGLRRIRRD